MNWKRRIAKEWFWLLGSIAGSIVFWGVLGLYKPPLIETDVQPVRRTYPSRITTDFKPVRPLTEEELKTEAQRRLEDGVPREQAAESSLPSSSESWEVVSTSYTIEKWNELRIFYAVLLVPFLYFMRISVWSFKQIRKKPK